MIKHRQYSLQSKHKLAIALIGFCEILLLGCFKPRQGPLPTNAIQMSLKSEIHHPSLKIFADGTLNEHAQDIYITMEEAAMKKLLAAMIPYEYMPGKNMPEDQAIDCQVAYQVSREPLIFSVFVLDDNLLFVERKYVKPGDVRQNTYVYEGGNADRFRDIVAAIIACR